MSFRLADLTVHWSGVDSGTPPGHCQVDATDELGRMSIYLFVGSEPLDDAYRGRVQLRSDVHSQSIAYGPGGGYVASDFDTAELLARLADRATEETRL